MRALLAAAGACSALILAAPPAAACTVTRNAEMKIEMFGGMPTVVGAVGGKPFRLLVSSGANMSGFTRAAAARLGLQPRQMDRMRVVVGGEEINPMGVRLNQFELGGVAGRDTWFIVLPGDMGAVDGTIGNDFFRDQDVEFDFPGGALRLFTPKDCADAWLAYWSDTATTAPLQTIDVGKTVEVKVNGHRVQAKIATGGPASLLSLQSARAAGVGPDTPGAQPAEPLDGGAIQTWLVPVDSFSIGEEQVNRTRLRVGDFNAAAARTASTGSNVSQAIFDETQMQLGADFFASHRVLIAQGQRKMYVSYMGGGVFKRTAAQPAAGR